MGFYWPGNKSGRQLKKQTSADCHLTMILPVPKERPQTNWSSLYVTELKADSSSELQTLTGIASVVEAHTNSFIFKAIAGTIISLIRQWTNGPMTTDFCRYTRHGTSEAVNSKGWWNADYRQCSGYQCTIIFVERGDRQNRKWKEAQLIYNKYDTILYIFLKLFTIWFMLQNKIRLWCDVCSWSHGKTLTLF